MAEQSSFRKPLGTFSQFATLLCTTMLALASIVPANAQIHGIPPSVTSIPNHFGPYGVPNIPPSVTSLGPYGYCCQGPSNVPYRNPAFPNRYNRGGRNGYGYGYGYGYSIPYYYAYPADDSGYYGGGGGQYLYSGPPQGGPPAEQTLHIVVDSGPQRSDPRDEIADVQPDRPAATIPDAKPGLPTTLVFRDGHQQEVTNYAIMGQTLYVFDNRTKKIALADLDVPATVKANDEEGVEFEVPQTKQSSKPAKNGMPLQNVPDAAPKTSSPMTSTP